MMVSVSRSIGARIAVVAITNLALLIAVSLAAVGVRFPRSFSDLAMQTARERLLDVSRQIALDLQRAPAARADGVLDGYAARHGARFIVATNDGVRVAGDRIAIPRDVAMALRGPGSGGGRGPESFDDASRPPPHPRPFGDSARGDGPPLPGAPPFLTVVDSAPKYWIGLRIPIRFLDVPEITPGTVLIVSNRLVGTPLLFPTRWLLWGALALALSIACWWPLLHGITASVHRMEQATTQIAEGNFDAAVTLARRDELGRLAGAIAQMAARLNTLVTGQKRFLGDTAHELRSPLGRLQVALDLIERDATGPATGYVQDAKADVEEMTRLTNDLLTYARTTLPGAAPRVDRVCLAEAVDAAVAHEAAGAANVRVDIAPDLIVTANRPSLERALANVLRNSMRYAPHGHIHIYAAHDDGHVQLIVDDDGPGVPEESLPRLFEPFYRVDAARSRDAGGVGLGLAIVRSALESMGGTVTAHNRVPQGLRMTLSLLAAKQPLNSTTNSNH